MSARFVDALKGYEYFISRRGKPSRQEVNRELARQGRSHISARTYTHYRLLKENGFRSYVPINKFDVFQAIGELPLSPDRRRFSREMVSEVAEVSFDGEHWSRISLVDRSIVGFGAATSNVLKAKKGDAVIFRIEAHKDIPCTLAWLRREGGVTRFGVRALGFIADFSTSLPSALSERLSGTVRLYHKSSEPISWSELFRILRQLNDLLEAARGLIMAVSEAARVPAQIAPPVVATMTVGSPADIQVKVDFGVADIIRVITEKVQFWGLQKKRYRSETETVDLQNANLRIEIARKAINLRKQAREEGLPPGITEELIAPSLAAIGITRAPAGLFEPSSLEAGIAKQRLLPAAAELLAGDDPDLELEVERAAE
jgi:hypothetical protein